MSWLLIALLPPMLFAASNYIDKYLISRYFKNQGAGGFILFSAFISLLPISLLLIFLPDALSVPPTDAFLMIAAGAYSILYLIPYFHALGKADVSAVIPFFQIIPVFSFILGYAFLDEHLTLQQMFAAIFIMGGSAGIASASKHTGRKSTIGRTIFWCMLGASFLIALNIFLFKFVAEDVPFWTTSFWEYVGLLGTGVIFFSLRKEYRRQFLSLLRDHGTGLIALNIVNELITLSAVILFHYATLLAPLALVSVIGGTHPFFVLLYGLVLTLFFPKIIKEDVSRRTLFYKLGFIVLIFIGTVLLGQSA